MEIFLVDRLEELLCWKRTVSVTGDDPYEARAIKKIISLEGGLVGDGDVWQAGQVVVVGRKNFDKNYLRESVRILYVDNKTPCEYLSQDDFWNCWLNRKSFVPYFRGDPRIQNHPGLKFISSIGFKWPEFSQSNEFESGVGGFFDRLNPESRLKSAFGYNVRQGTSLKERRQNLRRAVKPAPFGMGLLAVVETINGHIGRSHTQEKRLAEAIVKWQEDLDWLKKEFYNQSIHTFIWPSI